MKDAPYEIFINLIGGAIVIFFERFISFLIKLTKGYKYKRIFGNDSDVFQLVYGKMLLKPQYSVQDKFPYYKPNISGMFSISSPISFAETRAAKYISESFSRNKGESPRLISDDEIKDKIDISYCSLGGYNNQKSLEIIESIQNEYFEFNLNSTGLIINKKNRNYIYTVNGNYDYAIIIKIKHRLFPNRTQICVSGLGEWGTSGGAWFLAYKWKELYNKVGDKKFGAVIKVQGGKDESAELIDIVY